jgi:hypothetical protein
MKKIIALLLLSFSLQSQTLIKYKQMENPTTTTTLGVWGGIGNTIGSSSNKLGTLDSYPLNIYTNNSRRLSFTSDGMFKFMPSSATSTNNGYLYYDTTLTGMTFVRTDTTGSTYNFTWKNKRRYLGLYMPGLISPVYGFQFGSSDNTGIAFSPGGNIVMGANTQTCVITKPLRVGSTTAPSATLDVAGTLAATGAATIGGVLNVTGQIKAASTLSLGATVLTGANATGTVATLSDATWDLNFNPINFNPADAQTYYITNLSYGGNNFAANMGTVTLQYNCTLVGWDFNYYLGGTTGTTETSTLSIRANNSTDTQLSASIQLSSGSATGYSATGLTNTFNSGDRINIKWQCPTWVTNPTQVYIGITLHFVRR